MVLQYRADHGPRPILLSRYMELLGARRRYNMSVNRLNGLCGCCNADDSRNACLCLSLYACVMVEKQEEKKRWSTAEENSVRSTGPCGATRLRQTQTAIASWASAPNEMQEMLFWRLYGGLRGPDEDPT